MRILVTFALDAEFAPWRRLRRFRRVALVTPSMYEARVGAAEEDDVVIGGVDEVAFEMADAGEVEGVGVNGSPGGLGGGGIYVSDDEGEHWQATENSLQGQFVYSFVRLGTTLFAATGDRVWRSDDAGGTWRLAANGLPNGSFDTSVFTVSSRSFR